MKVEVAFKADVMASDCTVYKLPLNQPSTVIMKRRGHSPNSGKFELLRRQQESVSHLLHKLSPIDNKIDNTPTNFHHNAAILLPPSRVSAIFITQHARPKKHLVLKETQNRLHTPRSQSLRWITYEDRILLCT